MQIKVAEFMVYWLNGRHRGSITARTIPLSVPDLEPGRIILSQDGDYEILYRVKV